MSTAQDLPLSDGAPAYGTPVASPQLRLVPTQPLDFDDAVRRVRLRLQRYAVRRLGDAHDAEELVQEALLRAYTHRDQLLTEEDLSAWTTVVTGRLVIDRLRVRGRSTSFADVPETGRVGRDTADVVVARDEARTALDALDAMPARQASLLWAREVEGHSYEELCVRFGMTEPAVRSVLTRARKALRKEYALRGGTLPVGGLAVLAPWVAGLTWAGKLRRAASRLTAPAALGAVSVTTLGGLMLSPFGATPTPGTATFTPAQAIVTSVTSATTARSPDPAPRRGLTVVVRAPDRSPNGAGDDDPRPRILAHPLRGPEQLDCSQADENGVTGELPPVVDGRPYGIGLGGSHCAKSPNEFSVTIGENPTEYDSLDIGTDLITCDAVTPITQTVSQVTCKETAP